MKHDPYIAEANARVAMANENYVHAMKWWSAAAHCANSAEERSFYKKQEIEALKMSWEGL